MAPRLIVVDDDTVVRTLVVRIAAREGISCLEVASASGLPGACAAAPAAAVLCDINLGRDDGVAACLEQLRRRPELRVAMMTGDPAEAARASSAGFPAVLLKPFAPWELGEVLRRLLDGPEPSAAPPS